MADQRCREAARLALDGTVTRFNAEHRALLEINSSERSMTHKFAEILKEELSKLGLQDWDVDCEYNREGPHGNRKEVGVLRQEFMALLSRYDISPEDAVEMLASDQATAIFPDIIVHRRTTRDNLLVIEAKKTSAPPTRASRSRSPGLGTNASSAS